VKGDSGKVDTVVVGSVALDTIQTPFARREDMLGGSVSYACAAASFYSSTGMVGIVGDDFPDEHLSLYDGFGIDLQGLQRVEGKTFRWSGVYEDDMINRRTLSTELNVFESFTPELPEAYRRAPFLLLGNISPTLQLHVLGQAEAARFVAADTMDLWINTARDALDELIGRVDMLMLNDAEARLLTGVHNLRRGGEKILASGPRYVVIKKGEHGAMLMSEHGIFVVPAYPVLDVRDPTGAGDTFAGGFLGALSAGTELNEAAVRNALLYGSTVASIGVEEFSLGALAKLDREAIDSRLAELKAMMSPGEA